MTASITNLRQARKAKARAARERAAEENCRTFGQSKAARRLAAAEDAFADRRLDGLRRDPSDPEPKE
jgi:hypothetical protein